MIIIIILDDSNIRAYVNHLGTWREKKFHKKDGFDWLIDWLIDWLVD